MNKRLIAAILGAALCVGNALPASALTLSTDKSVAENSTDRITASITIDPPVTGDLYVAVEVKGSDAFSFITPDGQLSADPVPFATGTLSGTYNLPSYSSVAVPPGKYDLFTVITNPGVSPLDPSQWIGGPNSFKSLEFSNGLPAEVSGDMNGDGFPDTDQNHDGYPDGQGPHDQQSTDGSNSGSNDGSGTNGGTNDSTGSNGTNDSSGTSGGSNDGSGTNGGTNDSTGSNGTNDSSGSTQPANGGTGSDSGQSGGDQTSQNGSGDGQHNDGH